MWSLSTQVINWFKINATDTIKIAFALVARKHLLLVEKEYQGLWTWKNERHGREKIEKIWTFKMIEKSPNGNPSCRFKLLS